MLEFDFSEDAVLKSLPRQGNGGKDSAPHLPRETPGDGGQDGGGGTISPLGGLTQPGLDRDKLNDPTRGLWGAGRSSPRTAAEQAGEPEDAETYLSQPQRGHFVVQTHREVERPRAGNLDFLRRRVSQHPAGSHCPPAEPGPLLFWGPEPSWGRNEARLGHRLGSCGRRRGLYGVL